jgi:heme exporter protein B
LIRQIGAVFAKDVLIEWRSPSRWSGVFFFALALLLMVAFASGPGAVTLRKQAAASLWIALLLASTRSLDRSFAVELENGALEGMVTWPVDPRAIFYGKALANTALLAAVALAVCPLAIALFDAPVRGNLLHFGAFLGLGCAALAAPGTLYSLLTSQARGASVLLPVLLFPLVVPALVSAARGTAVVLEGDPMVQAPSWLGLLAAFNAIHWSLSGVLFGKVVEES